VTDLLTREDVANPRRAAQEADQCVERAVGGRQSVVHARPEVDVVAVDASDVCPRSECALCARVDQGRKSRRIESTAILAVRQKLLGNLGNPVVGGQSNQIIGPSDERVQPIEQESQGAIQLQIDVVDLLTAWAEGVSVA